MDHQLAGEIHKDITLFDIFETLSRKSQHGQLYVQFPQKTYKLYFHDTQVTLVDIPSEKMKFLPHKLYYAGKLPKHIYMILREHKDSWANLQTSVPAGDLEKAMRVIYFDEMCDMFFHTTGHFYFTEGEESSGKNLPCNYFFETSILLMEIARRLDEWPNILRSLPNFSEIFIPTQKETSEEFPEDIIRMTSDLCTIQEMADYSIMSSFDLLRQLQRLYPTSLRLLTENELENLSRISYQQKKWTNALRYFSLLNTRHPNYIHVHSYIIHCYNKLADTANLFAFYTQSAERLLSTTDSEYWLLAVKYLKKSTEYLHDVDKKMNIHLEVFQTIAQRSLPSSKVPYDMIKEGKKLINFFTNHPTKILSVLGWLRSYYPNDFEIAEIYIQKLFESKDIPQTALECENLAEQYHIARKYTLAKKIYHTWMDIAPYDHKVPAKLVQIKNEEKQYYARRLRRGWIILVIFFFILFVGLYSYQQNLIQSKYREKQKKILEQIECGHLLDAKNSLEEMSTKDQIVLQEKIIEKQNSIDEHVNSMLSQIESNFVDRGDLEKALEMLNLLLSPLPSYDIRTIIFQKKKIITGMIEEFYNDLSAARKSEKSGNYAESILKYLALWNDPRFRILSTKENIQLPLQCFGKNIPKIEVDGVVRTPEKNFILHCSPEFKKITLSSLGYETKEFYNAINPLVFLPQDIDLNTVHPLTEYTVDVTLKKAMTMTIPLEGKIVGEICYEKNLYLVCNNGYIYTVCSSETALELVQKEYINSGAYFVAKPVYCNEVLYLTDYEGNFYAVSVHTQHVLGKFASGKRHDIGYPALVFRTLGMVVFCSNTGKISGLPLWISKVNWQPVWEKSIPNSIVISIESYKDTIIVSTGDGVIYCLHPTTGKMLWQIRLNISISNPLSIFDTLGYIGVGSSVYAIDLENGKLASKVDVIENVCGKILVKDGIICFTTSNRLVCCFSTSGRFVWQTKVYGLLQYGPVLGMSGERLFVICQQGYVYAISIKDGHIFWQYEIVEEIPSYMTAIPNWIVLAGKKLYIFLDN